MASNGYRGYRYKTGVEINATTDALLVGNVRTMHTHARTHARTHACKQSVDQPAILSLSLSLSLHIYIYIYIFCPFQYRPRLCGQSFWIALREIPRVFSFSFPRQRDRDRDRNPFASDIRITVALFLPTRRGRLVRETEREKIVGIEIWIGNAFSDDRRVRRRRRRRVENVL